MTLIKCWNCKGSMQFYGVAGYYFRLSRRWQKYGNASFEEISWAQFGEAQIRSQVQKWHTVVAKSEPTEQNKEKRVCQK